MAKYEIDGALFVENPIIKTYSRATLGTYGDGSPALAPTWTLEVEFSALLAASGTQPAFIFDAWQSGDAHAVKIPHPLTGAMTVFSGCNITVPGWSFGDIDRDRWIDGAKMKISNIDTSLAW